MAGKMGRWNWGVGLDFVDSASYTAGEDVFYASSVNAMNPDVDT